MTDALGIQIGSNLPTAVLCAHLVVAGLFFAAAVLGLTGGTALPGVALRAVTGTLVVGLGVATARLV